MIYLHLTVKGSEEATALLSTRSWRAVTWAPSRRSFNLLNRIYQPLLSCQVPREHCKVIHAVSSRRSAEHGMIVYTCRECGKSHTVFRACGTPLPHLPEPQGQAVACRETRESAPYPSLHDHLHRARTDACLHQKQPAHLLRGHVQGLYPLRSRRSLQTNGSQAATSRASSAFIPGAGSLPITLISITLSQAAPSHLGRLPWHASRPTSSSRSVPSALFKARFMMK